VQRTCTTVQLSQTPNLIAPPPVASYPLKNAKYDVGLSISMTLCKSHMFSTKNLLDNNVLSENADLRL